MNCNQWIQQQFQYETDINKCEKEYNWGQDDKISPQKNLT